MIPRNSQFFHDAKYAHIFSRHWQPWYLGLVGDGGCVQHCCVLHCDPLSDDLLATLLQMKLTVRVGQVQKFCNNYDRTKLSYTYSSFCKTLGRNSLVLLNISLNSARLPKMSNAIFWTITGTSLWTPQNITLVTPLGPRIQIASLSPALANSQKLIHLFVHHTVRIEPWWLVRYLLN